MRIAYVGLSGPLFYDYRQQAQRAPSDMSSSPNPILDSPYGLLLMYDEIWFLCRSLCPQNMRTLPYVRFLDEAGALPDLTQIDVEQQTRDIYARSAERVGTHYRDYVERVEQLGVNWDAAPDSHTHGLFIGGLETSASSGRLECILFDLEVLKKLGRNDVELVANSFGHSWLEATTPSVHKAGLAQALVIEHIPNYLSPEGPYHEVVEEARANSYLTAFRKWVDETSGAADVKDVAEIKAEVEAALADTQRRIFMNYLDENRCYYSVGKTLLGFAADLAVPLVGTGSGLVQDLREARAAREIMWQGFLVSIS